MENFRGRHNINFTPCLNLCSKVERYVNLHRLGVPCSADEKNLKSGGDDSPQSSIGGGFHAIVYLFIRGMLQEFYLAGSVRVSLARRWLTFRASSAVTPLPRTKAR